MARFNNQKGTELIWQGKYDEQGRLSLPERVSWPFQTIETVNESKFDREKQRDLFYQKNETGTWRNRLIWGDNKYIMSSLLEEFAGKIDLIYIDPPFATGADFSYKADIGDAEAVKEPSMIEEIAYRDTWGKGMDSFLQMMFERLIFMKDLLSEGGSIYIHLDWHVGHYVKIIMDEVFGRESFVNEIIWYYGERQQPWISKYNSKHDVIYFYTRSNNYIFNMQFKPYTQEYINQFFNKFDKQGRRYQSTDGGKGKERYIRYLDECKGVAMDSVWDDIKMIGNISMSNERMNFPTQKPEKLLERIIFTSSDASGLVADFFCGSGTTGAVAEKLGRRWIMSDLSRFAIQTTRKRLLQIENCSPFIIQNLGKYERQYWYNTFGTEGINKRQEYINTILKFYKAQPVTGF
ncbi:MAG: site-specific DNA-methyltransferase, partial [Actinobacteria bacterium]|nr:site-specific DNA-methyltransferase [Actinomycetota bacterium]